MSAELRNGKDEIQKWEALQVRRVLLCRNDSSIIQSLQEMQHHGNYGALRCLKGIEDAVVQQQMDQLNTLMRTMKNVLEELWGCVLKLEKLHRESLQLQQNSSRDVERLIGFRL